VDKKEQYNQFIQLIKEAVDRDQLLRDQYQIGDKFRFIREKLNQLLMQLEESKLLIQKEKKENETRPVEDEQLIYVYLFNTHGLNLQNWAKMLTPQGFYEYSVNRPIYSDRAHIEAFIRAKPSKVQHAFLVVVLHKSNIISLDSGKDPLGHSLIKVKEGSLRFEKLVSFIYNDFDYVMNEDKQLVKKNIR